MNISPQMMRQSMGMMENMDQKQMENMAEKATEMQKSGFLPNGKPIPSMASMQNAANNFKAASKQPEEVDDNLEIIDNFKSIGNQKFKNGDFDKAVHYYNQGLGEIEELIPQYLEENKSVNQLMKRQVTINLNITMVYQRQEKWSESIELVDKVIKLDKKNGKAYYRRAISLEKLGKNEEAVKFGGEALKHLTGKSRTSKYLLQCI